MYLLNFLQQFNFPLISKILLREEDPAALDIDSSFPDISYRPCLADYGIGNLLDHHTVRSLFPLSPSINVTQDQIYNILVDYLQSSDMSQPPSKAGFETYLLSKYETSSLSLLGLVVQEALTPYLNHLIVTLPS